MNLDLYRARTTATTTQFVSTTRICPTCGRKFALLGTRGATTIVSARQLLQNLWCRHHLEWFRFQWNCLVLVDNCAVGWNWLAVVQMLCCQPSKCCSWGCHGRWGRRRWWWWVRRWWVWWWRTGIFRTWQFLQLQQVLR